MNRSICLRLRFRKMIGFGAIPLILTGCSLFHREDSPSADQKAACGQQCLSNGEKCSAFFATKNEERRLLFEQAKQNFWICLKKYPGTESHPDNPCIAPSPEPEMFDSCGQQLDECLEACETNLDELAAVTRKQENHVNIRQPIIDTQ